MLFAGLGRSVLAKTELEVSSTARGRRPRAVLETSFKQKEVEFRSKEYEEEKKKARQSREKAGQYDANVCPAESANAIVNLKTG